MISLKYQGKSYPCRDGESVLEAFLRQGVKLPFSCRAGVCHVCLQRATSGEVPKDAQKGLKDDLVAKNYFLPCICKPTADLSFAPPQEADLFFTAVVAEKTILANDIVQLKLEPSLNMDYLPGQFINLKRADGVIRSYSLASVPAEDYFLELHVKRMKNGDMSHWLCDELEPGEEIEVQGPNGDCYYHADAPQQDILLIATGTGLAPLLGIARMALNAGHGGQIHLYHGSSMREGLYLVDELNELAHQHPHFHYTPCVSREACDEPFVSGRAEDVALSRHRTLSGWRIHLAGNPEMVEHASKLVRDAGARVENIFADPFVLKELRAEPRPADSAAKVFPPDPEMWAGLKEGELMNVILTDFYTRVFDDPILSPYFIGVTKQRLIEKVYSFMRQIFTGEKMYFGDRPRNTHHWMVISDEIFDHRERLMEECMRRHGLADHLIVRWQAIEEAFRGDIVKSQPVGRVVDGVEQPFVDGFGHEILEVGTLCDSCGRVIEVGEAVSYHLRLGHVYCHDCRKG